jgi:hypothetical protein
MSKIREEKPNSLPEFLALIEQLQTDVEDILWYRGCGRGSHTLIPSLYRHKKAKTTIQLADLERKLITRFRQRSLPYLSRSITEDWDTLFFMQHYGIPTRLLDWTENPLTSLYFALMGAPYKSNAKGEPKFKEAASVWILDPVKWNRRALRHQSYKGGALTPGDDALNGYKPFVAFSGMNNYPVALYGAHNSPRIVAQQGVFTIFGQDTVPMEKLYEEEEFPEGSLIRVTIEKTYIARMRKSLLGHGITESVVFPDLEGLALEIKRSFGFVE